MDALLGKLWVHLSCTSRWIQVQPAMQWSLDGGSVWMLYRLVSRCTLRSGHYGCPMRNLLMHRDSEEHFTMDAQLVNLWCTVALSNFVITHGPVNVINTVNVIVKFTSTASYTCNIIGCNDMVNHLRPLLSESLEEGRFYFSIYQCSDLLDGGRRKQVPYKAYLIIIFSIII